MKKYLVSSIFFCTFAAAKARKGSLWYACYMRVECSNRYIIIGIC